MNQKANCLLQNWFQNRRAKAKQQKRQKEFERMQAQKEAEKSKENENSSDSAATTTATTTTTTPADESKKSETSVNKETSAPAEAPSVPAVSVTEKHRATPGSNSRKPNRKPNDASGQSASFASLQRALNAAVAARSQFCQEQHETPPPQTQGPIASPGIPPSVVLSSEHAQPQTATLSEWGENTEPPLVWTPHTPDATFDMSAMNCQPQSRDGDQAQTHPENYHQVHPNNEAYPNVQYPQHQPDGWSNQWHAPTGSGMPEQGANGETYNMAYSSLHPSIDQLSRRGSCSEELADSFGNIGIQSVGQSPQHHSQLNSPMESTNLRPHPEREVDLAARRKRPRPAAIGTASLNRSLVGPSSMSPTARMSGLGAGHAVRHAKSTQNLNSSRYPGIRKVSSAQRSPLGLSNFTEAGVFRASSNAEMTAMMCPPPVAPTTLAPPTPLTPEDLHNFLPTTPSEGKFGLSPNPQIAGNYIYPAQQSMQIDISSPPSTPMTFDIMNQLQYQSMVPPMSAPSHFTTFQDISSPCSSGQINTGAWSDAPQPSPDDNSSFQHSTVIHMPQPTHISPITYEPHLDQCSQPEEDWKTSPQLCALDNSSTSPPEETTPVKGEREPEFLIQEFPQQQEAHRHAAQQLPQQKPKTYTFANQTPNDF